MSVGNDRGSQVQGAGTMVAGGIALILGALAFLVVFSYLAARFDYPTILDGNANLVLPALLATGDAGRAAWAIYGFLPLIFIPAGVGAFAAFRARAEGAARIGMFFAVVAALSMMLGLLRWPSMYWELARVWSEVATDQRVVLATVFDGLNLYLGNYIGEFLGELSFSMFFLLSSVGLFKHPRAPRWLGVWGFATGVLGLIGMWRNVTSAVDIVAEVNNYLLPAWMIGMGVWLVLASRPAVAIAPS